MSNNSGSSAGGGIGFWGILQIVFIILKLCKVISWSWWWVLSPTLAGVVFVLIILAVFIYPHLKKWR